MVEKLRVVESANRGITLFSGRVRSNVVFDVDENDGIEAFSAAVVSDNFVSRVGGTGILVRGGSSVVGNSVEIAGRDGVSAQCPSRLTDNAVTGVTGVDIFTAGNGCSVLGNASF